MTYTPQTVDPMGDTASLYPSAGTDNPLYADGGGLKDLNGPASIGPDGWGDGMNKETRAQLISAYMGAQATVTAAQIEAQATAYAAKVGAEAAINSALASADAAKYASDNDLAGIQAQVQGDLEIAKLEQETEFAKLEVEKESIEVDKMNAEANQTTANASIISANAEQTEADAELEESQNEDGSGDVF